MKIAYLLNSVSRKAGGLFEICKRLAQTTCDEKEIVVLGVEDEFTKTDLIEWAPLRPTIFSPVFARSFGYAPGYAQYLAKACPDIAHVHGLWTYSSLAGYRWHRRTNRPLIYTAHGMLAPWALRNSAWKKRLVCRLWEDAAHRSAACFHVNSEAEHLMLRQHGLRNPICIVPNGIDLPASQSSDSSLISGLASIARGRKLLLYLGRLHPKKNLVNLIRAWKEALNTYPPTLSSWVLAIAGWDQGGHEAQLRQLTTDLRLLTSVIFLGPQFGADKEACYRACDAFILPSLSEGLPMTVLEASAYARPVLMTPECNLPEGFATGAALQIGTTPKEIAAGLKQLIEMSDDDRKAVGARGRVLVVEKFSWPRIGEQMRSVYEWVLGGGRVPETLRLSETGATR
ncbi:MAG: glycosyl transferase family 1 [Verrucomicrobia bacterium]|nr:MAG: glycosyl transferase family 1 [Verrucomicrobiota bacterium]